MKADREFYCPIFEKMIKEGLCWEICFAGEGIKLDSIPELVEWIKKHSLSLKKIHETFCFHCKYCQWKNKD